MRKLRAAHLAAVLLGAGLVFISAIDGFDALHTLRAFDPSGAVRAAHPKSPAASGSESRPDSSSKSGSSSRLSANPCEDEISDITGTIQACTMITDSLGISSTVLTTSLQIVAGIQDPETGPTTHYSNTVDGQAFWYGLHTTRPWFIAVQVGDFPLKNVRLVGPFQIFGVYVGEAVTFHFECFAEPCDELAPTPTPRPTWVTPTRTFTPLPTEPGTATLEHTETPTPTPTDTSGETPTPDPSEPVEPTADPPTQTPDLPPTEVPVPPPTETPEPPTAEPPPLTEIPPATEIPTPLPTEQILRPIYFPVVSRRW